MMMGPGPAERSLATNRHLPELQRYLKFPAVLARAGETFKETALNEPH